VEGGARWKVQLGGEVAASVSSSTLHLLDLGLLLWRPDSLRLLRQQGEAEPAPSSPRRGPLCHLSVRRRRGWEGDVVGYHFVLLLFFPYSAPVRWSGTLDGSCDGKRENR
jgi:hypothetical protein